MLRTLAARALAGASSSSSSAATTTTAASIVVVGASSSSLFSSSSRSYAAGPIKSKSGANDADYGLAAGVPEELLNREVVIFSPSRTPSQQGMSQTKTEGGLGKGASWRIEFGTQQKWVNPLMGWTSTADPYENVGRAGMSFDTAEAARAFCEKHGWRYAIREGLPSARLRPARFFQYGDNFSVKRRGYPEGGLVSENGGSVEVRGREAAKGSSAGGAVAAAAKGKGKK